MPGFQAALVDKLHDPRLSSAAYVALLGKLLQHRDSAADVTAAQQVQSPVPADGPERQRFNAVCVAVLENPTPVAWRSLWKTIRDNAEAGEQFLLSIARSFPRRIELLPFPLPEQDLADVYEWLRDRFPPKGDPAHHDSHMHPVTGREGVAALRDGFLQALQQRGTADAVSAIAGLVARRPDLPDLRRALEACRRTAVQHTWTPPTVAELLGLLNDGRSRLVVNAEHLLDLVIESVGRWQVELQGPTPAAYRLWNSSRSDTDAKHWPKPEDKLSDDLQRHLQRDLGPSRGIVANREVVIRHGEKPGSKGERLDILVQALRDRTDGPANDAISVVIEVKGCWNSGLFTDMQQQLRDRYLADNDCRHGLYIVGWYECLQWDAGDSRRRSTPRMPMADVAAQLAAQAAQLSVDGVTLRSMTVDVRLR